MKHFVVGVDWYGPYSRSDAIADAKHWGGGGLYLAIGCCGRETIARPQYVGLSSNLTNRLRNHHKLPLLKPGEQVWLGYAATEQSGRRLKATPRTLDDAEWCHAYFMELPLNERKAGSPPRQNVTVLNRWWRVDGTPRRRRPHASWPDLFDYMGAEHRSRLVWFGGRVRDVSVARRCLCLSPRTLPTATWAPGATPRWSPSTPIRWPAWRSPARW